MKKVVFRAGDLFPWRSWGEGFVDINEAGHLEMLTTPDGKGRVDLSELVEALPSRSLRLPVLVRFPQIIDAQIDKLHRAFRSAMRTFDYQSSYASVYPLKVNHNPDTVARVYQSGKKYGAGLEVGTKAELCIALSVLDRKQGPIICNGYKDFAYLQLAAAAYEAGCNIVVIIERPREYELIQHVIRQGWPCPTLGVRVKLHASGMGRWEESSGDLSKFGLTASELIEATRVLRQARLLHRLRLMHFHLGSQITNIRNFKQALQEALRFYVELKELGVPLEMLDVGGGLGVDYDGSKSSADSSVNYNAQEYANDIIYSTKEVAGRARIAEPNIITEAGRFLVAHHAALLVEPLEQPQQGPKTHRGRTRASNVDAVNELEDLASEINSKNWREYLHDAYQKKDEMLSAFSLGFLSLEQRAQAESAYSRVVEQANQFARTGRFDGAERAALERIASRLHPFNFSIFKSMPDSWILDMLFPILPVSRLKEKPVVKATIADLTCDSDGVINKFSHPTEIRSSLELHQGPWSKSYAVAILLLGAYQEALGSDHNLFGRPAEINVETDPRGKVHITVAKPPETCGEILADLGFTDTSENQRSNGRQHEPPSSRALRRVLAGVLAGSTYLDQSSRGSEAQATVSNILRPQKPERMRRSTRRASTKV